MSNKKSKSVSAFFTRIFFVLLLTNAIEDARASQNCAALFTSVAEVQSQFIPMGGVINQQNPRLELANSACGLVCVTNLMQIILNQNGERLIEDPVTETNDLNRLRVHSPENGATFEEIIAMLQTLSAKYFPNRITTTASILNIRGNFHPDEDKSIARTDEIVASQLISLHAKTLSKFNIVSFAALYNGELLGGHGILVLGVDEQTGYVMILDPRIGKIALVSFDEEVILGKKTLVIKYQRSGDSDPYWATYQDYGKIVVTGFIGIEVRH